MNPELEEQLELERLIAEQEKDDSQVVYGEKGHEHDVSIEGMENAISVDEDGEVTIDLPRERGSILTGAATWHGTVAGYTKQGCRCPKCRKAQRDYMREYQRAARARKREEASS